MAVTSQQSLYVISEKNIYREHLLYFPLNFRLQLRNLHTQLSQVREAQIPPHQTPGESSLSELRSNSNVSKELIQHR